jgi:integrase
LLKAHKAHQATIKMANRTAYREAGLVFAKTLGAPVQMHNIGQWEFAPLIKAAGVRRIKFHGLRHTNATLLLLAGVPAKVVSERLGHSKIAITLDTYSHVLPSMGQAAAAQIGALLHG